MVSKLRAKSNSPLLFQKRSDIDIMANILSEANENTKKTRIMYRCNLSHSQLQVYLQILHDLGFLASHPKKKDTKPKYFRTTSKGFKFLDAYRTLKNLMT
jgi:predicted transcriptional regulator